MYIECQIWEAGKRETKRIDETIFFSIQRSFPQACDVICIMYTGHNSIACRIHVGPRWLPVADTGHWHPESGRFGFIRDNQRQEKGTYCGNSSKNSACTSDKKNWSDALKRFFLDVLIRGKNINFNKKILIFIISYAIYIYHYKSVYFIHVYMFLYLFCIYVLILSL